MMIGLYELNLSGRREGERSEPRSLGGQTDLEFLEPRSNRCPFSFPREPRAARGGGLLDPESLE